MMKPIELIINDRIYHLEIESNETLLHVLRERLGLNGTKDGCREGDCGACTVLVEGSPFNACLLLAVRMKGKRIETIEGLSKNGLLYPLLVNHQPTSTQTTFTQLYPSTPHLTRRYLTNPSIYGILLRVVWHWAVSVVKTG